jgi:hypothetical protein
MDVRAPAQSSLCSLQTSTSAYFVVAIALLLEHLLVIETYPPALAFSDFCYFLDALVYVGDDHVWTGTSMESL